MHTIAIPDFAVARGHAMFPDKEIDPTTTAVIVVDLQRFFIDEGQPMGNPHARDIIANVNRITAAARSFGSLVVFIQHSAAEPGTEGNVETEASSGAALLPGNPSYDIHVDLVRRDTDVNVVKHRSSPLHPKAASGLNEALEKADIQTIIITGVASNGCCESLARDASQHDLDVIFASDASAAMTDEEHNAALLNVGLYYARVKSADEIILALERGSTAE